MPAANKWATSAGMSRKFRYNAATKSTVLIAGDGKSARGQSTSDALLDEVERLAQDWVENRKIQEAE